MLHPSIVYASFDQFPSSKGAATHIGAFCRALANEFRCVNLITLKGVDDLQANIPKEINHFQLSALGPNIITRAMAFRSEMHRWWGNRRFNIAHVRSIFEGYPIAKHKKDLCDFFVYEMNGLPSIELKYHYPDVYDDEILINKLRKQEEVCLNAADLIITVSDINAQYLLSRVAEKEKIKVIPNGVDLSIFNWKEPLPPRRETMKILYSGTMTRWQGVHCALEALALYLRDFKAELLLVGPCRNQQRKALNRTIDRLKIAKYVSFIEPLNQIQLVSLMHECDVTLAPLLPNDRNLEQGCCPLKVIEAMGAGIPVIASDLPVVSCLAENNIEALLVKPGSAKAIKDGLLKLRDDFGLRNRLSVAARRKVEREFRWDISTKKLINSYREMLS